MESTFVENLDTRLRKVEERIEATRASADSKCKFLEEEIVILEENINDHQRQCEYPQGHILPSVSSLSDLMENEIESVRQQREAFTTQGTDSIESVIRGLNDFHKKITCDETNASLSEEAKKALTEISVEVATLEQDRFSRGSKVATDLSRELNALEQQVDKEKKFRTETESNVEKMIEELRAQAHVDLQRSRASREQLEEHILQLLEDACIQVESAVRSRPMVAESGDAPTLSSIAGVRRAEDSTSSQKGEKSFC